MSYGLIREIFNKSLTASVSGVASFQVNHVETISIDLSVTGSPLTSFTIKIGLYDASSLHTMYSSATDYNQPLGSLIGASGDLTTLSSNGWLILDTRAMSQVVIEASSASTSTLLLKVGG